MSKQTSKGATARFTRRLILAFVIVLLIIAGAITIAYCKGSDKGKELYREELQGALLSAYNKGKEDAKAELIESAEITRFSLNGEDFVVYISFEGEEHDYHCNAGNVVEALPFQQGN